MASIFGELRVPTEDRAKSEAQSEVEIKGVAASEQVSTQYEHKRLLRHQRRRLATKRGMEFTIAGKQNYLQTLADYHCSVPCPIEAGRTGRKYLHGRKFDGVYEVMRSRLPRLIGSMDVTC